MDWHVKETGGLSCLPWRAESGATGTEGARSCKMTNGGLIPTFQQSELSQSEVGCPWRKWSLSTGDLGKQDDLSSRALCWVWGGLEATKVTSSTEILQLCELRATRWHSGQSAGLGVRKT